jgi:hypothetical protein
MSAEIISVAKRKAIPREVGGAGFARGLTPADLIELLPQLVEIAMFRVGHGAPVLRNKFCVATVLGSRSPRLLKARGP